MTEPHNARLTPSHAATRGVPSEPLAQRVEDVWVSLDLAAYAAHVTTATVTEWTLAGLIPVCCQCRPRAVLYLLAAVMRTEATLRNGPGYARLAGKLRKAG